MEQQIQDLIASIRKDGIESATNESKKILEEARKEADLILKEAKAEKEKMIADAKKEIELERESSISSVKQAARDVTITLKKSLEEKFQKILGEKVSKALDDETVIAEVLVSVLKGEFEDSEVVLPKEKIEGVRKILSEKLNGDLSKGIEFKASSLPNSGVKVYAKDGSAYIDLSDEECTRLLYPYLSSSLKELF